jgi:hypothetical protein
MHSRYGEKLQAGALGFVAHRCAQVTHPKAHALRVLSSSSAAHVHDSGSSTYAEFHNDRIQSNCSSSTV